MLGYNFGFNCDSFGLNCDSVVHVTSNTIEIKKGTITEAAKTAEYHLGSHP